MAHRLKSAVASALLLLRPHMVSAVIGVVASIASAVVYTMWFHARLTTVSIPVLSHSRDEQGFQFELGVSRAAQVAERFGLDTLGYARVRPHYLDEQENVDDLVSRVRALRPPIVIGPLRSESAEKIVPKIAEELRVPMILGIPTAKSLRTRGGGRVLWLSPHDGYQASVVSEALRRLQRQGSNQPARLADRKAGPALLVWDASQNVKYSEELHLGILQSTGAADMPEAIPLSDGNDSLARVATRLKAQRPETVIYVGMPGIARALLDIGLRNKLATKWIMTDGCMDDTGIMARAEALRQEVPGSSFYITYQAPPAGREEGLRRYRAYAQAVTPVRLGSADGGTRAPETSYEVFGFDSYLLALDLIRQADSRNAGAVAGTMRTLVHSGPLNSIFFLLGPYEFSPDGQNTRPKFHVYEIKDRTLEHLDGLCPSDGQAGEAAVR